VKFGCAKISMHTILHLNQAIIMTPFVFKQIGNINIGAGTFSPKDINVMADYYLNKQKVENGDIS
jgi:hypothetical protein